MEEQFLSDTPIRKGMMLIFKVLLYVVLLILFLVIGLFIGYVVIGGGNFWEVLNQDTWQHIINFVK